MVTAKGKVLKAMKYWWIYLGGFGTVATIILFITQGWNFWTQVFVAFVLLGDVAIYRVLLYIATRKLLQNPTDSNL